MCNTSRLTPSQLASSRRQWLHGAMLGSAGLALGGSYAGEARSAVAAVDENLDVSQLSPQQVITRLYDGNRRFAAGAERSPHRSIARLREVAPRQTPFAAFLGCADSRVPIEIVFDQGFGDLFVTRIAGNVASSENIGSLEFGTQVLGCKVLYVLGHTACGAVTATMKREAVPGQISSLFQHIRPAVKLAQGDLNRAIRENVRLQALTLAEASPVIARLIDEKKLIVAGGVYDLNTGVVTPVEIDETS